MKNLFSPSPWLAVDPASDRVAQARAIRRVYDAWHAGEPVKGGVRAVVGQSWQRSDAAGLDPVAHRAPIVLDDDAIADRWNAHPLYPILPILRELLSDATTQSGHMLVISDADGLLLWIEGHRRVIAATEDMHFVVGADWSEQGAGTNALGTALAVDHPVQIFSAEHFSRVVHPWQCSGAPIHDPETGAILGVVDLTGHLKTAHPHTLALVTAAAGMAEAYLRQAVAQRRALLRERYRTRTAGTRQHTALLDARGTLLDQSPSRWLPGSLEVPAEGGDIVLPDGSGAVAEPLEGGFVVWRRKPRVGDGGRRTRVLRLELLRARPRALVGDVAIELSSRRAELLCLLLLQPQGLTAEQLALDLYGESGRPVSVRAELSRLRRLLGDELHARPYRVSRATTSDLADVEALIASGELELALSRYSEPLLPQSEVPLVVEARERVEGALRGAVLDRRDPALLSRWCATAAGHDDEPAAELLLRSVDPGNPLHAEAVARLRRLRRTDAPVEPAAW